MSVLRICTRAILRQGVWRIVVVAMGIAVGGGAVLAAFAGASRSESAAPRYYAQFQAADASVTAPSFTLLDVPRIARIPADPCRSASSDWSQRLPRRVPR